MAADWIKMRGNLWDDPRVAALVDATDSSEATVVGGLYWLWSMADQHTEDGYLPGLSLRQIDRKTGIAGFGAALEAIGWIRASADGGIEIKHFAEHNGASAKKRAQTARRVANHKSGNAEDQKNEESGNAASVSDRASERYLEKEKEKEEEAPHSPPEGGVPAGKTSKRSEQIGLAAFLAACHEQGESAIPEDDAVFAYADRIGLPHEFVGLAWAWFKRKYANKRQAGVRGWRQTFRNAVEDNWPKYWYPDADGAFQLTSAGKQAQIAAEAGEA